LLVYIFLLFMSLLTLINNKINRGFYYLLWILMLLIAGFRYMVGTDYANYEAAFVSSLFWYSDLGFTYFTKLMQFLNLSPQAYFFTIALLIQVIIFFSLRKLTDTKSIFYISIFFYITLYYFNNSMNTLRQFIAIGIFIYNINNIINKRFISYTLLSGLMFLFHSSSIIFYPLYFIINFLVKLTKNKNLMYVLLMISFLLMFVRFDTIITNIIVGLKIEAYQYYVTWGAQSYLQYELSWKLFVVLLIKLILSYWIIKEKDSLINNKKDEKLFAIFFFGLLLTFPLYPMLIFRRLLFYINIIEVIIYANFVKTTKMRIFIFILYAVIFYFINLLSGFATPLPFKLRFFD